MKFLWELCKHRRSLKEKQHGLSSHDIRISDYLDFGLFADVCCVCVCITRVSSKPVFWFMSVRVDSCLWAFDTEHSNAVFLASRHTHKHREHLKASRLIGIKMKPSRCGLVQVCALCFTVNRSTVFFYTQAVLCFPCLGATRFTVNAALCSPISESMGLGCIYSTMFIWECNMCQPFPNLYWE